MSSGRGSERERAGRERERARGAAVLQKDECACTWNAANANTGKSCMSIFFSQLATCHMPHMHRKKTEYAISSSFVCDSIWMIIYNAELNTLYIYLTETLISLGPQSTTETSKETRETGRQGRQSKADRNRWNCLLNTYTYIECIYSTYSILWATVYLCWIHHRAVCKGSGKCSIDLHALPARLHFPLQFVRLPSLSFLLPPPLPPLLALGLLSRLASVATARWGTVNHVKRRAQIGWATHTLTHT